MHRAIAQSAYATARNLADLERYFDPEREPSATELQEVTFGEFLVEQGAIDRFQLFRALQMQDRMPTVRLGEAVAALGYASFGAIERHFARFQELATVDID